MSEIIKEDYKHWGAIGGARKKPVQVTYAEPETYRAAVCPLLLTHRTSFSIATAQWCFLSNYKLCPCFGFPSELSH